MSPWAPKWPQHPEIGEWGTQLLEVNSIVYSRDKESCTVCCLPGVEVECAGKLLARAGKDPVVMVHIGPW